MLATRIQDLEKELAFYFHDKKNRELHNGLNETSLNESMEDQLPPPLRPQCQSSLLIQLEKN